MRAGTFNINDYLNKLYEGFPEKDEKEDKKDKESKDKEKKEEHEAKESDKKEEKEEHEAKESDDKDDKEEKKDSPSKPSSPKQSTPVSKGSGPNSPKGITNTDSVDQEGIILPEENKKFYSWLKSEYQKGKTEVKVEMKLGDSKFEPGYEMQAQPDTVNEFKPGIFGTVKTADTGGGPSGGGAKTIGGNQPNTNNQVTGLSKPGEEGTGQGKELQKSKAMTVRSEQTKPMAGGEGKPAKAQVGQKPATPVAAKPEHGKEEGAEIEKIDIKTKKEKKDYDK
jgi:hypothetical protein